MDILTDPKLSLLRTLIPGEIVSLKEARQLAGLTEAQLAESVASLASAYPHFVTPAAGLQLLGDPDLLDADRFCAGLSEDLKTRVSRLAFYAVCESTSTEVTAIGVPESNSLNIALTEYQTGGQGRQGRKWTSGFSEGVCFTVAFRFDPSVKIQPTLTLAIGVQLATALDEFLTESVLLKWPNDLILGVGKLGGILVELSTLPEGDQLMRVGVGVNCGAPVVDVMSGAVPSLPPAGLKEFARGSLNRTAVASTLVAAVVETVDLHRKEGFESFRSTWQHLDFLRHQAVQVLDGERVRHGVAKGIDQYGALRVATDEGEISLMSGEVRVRRR
ncbi:MAG: biotin--[acetyl-CoA-carboxylase] ligase [Gammaproteobacteria bacterium]